MADFVYNQSKGKFAEYASRVNANDPANSVLVIVVIDTATADATLIDLDTLAAITGDAGTAEVTNTNYAREVIDNTGGITVTVDDTNDRTEVDIPDKTWSSVSAGDSWTDLLVCYDSDSTGGTDANIVPGTHHDFAVTPDGSDITGQFDAAGIFRAA